MVHKMAQPLALEKRNTPPIGVLVGHAATLAEAREAECRVCRCLAIKR